MRPPHASTPRSSRQRPDSRVLRTLSFQLQLDRAARAQHPTVQSCVLEHGSVGSTVVISRRPDPGARRRQPATLQPDKPEVELVECLSSLSCPESPLSGACSKVLLLGKHICRGCDRC